MQRNLLAAIPLAVCTALGSSAMAETITFQGSVIDNTCVPSVNGTGLNATIVLNPVSSNVLPANNSVSGPTPFTIVLTGCGTTNPHTVKAYFWQANAANQRLSKNPTNGGTGAGWQYQIRNANNTQNIAVGTTATINAANNINDDGVNVGPSGGSGTLNYNVRYYRTGNLTNGTLNATATYVIFSS